MKEAPPRLAAFAIGIVLVAGCAEIERAPQQSAPAAAPAGAIVPVVPVVPIVPIEPRGAPAATPPGPQPSLPAKGGTVASAPVIRPAEPARAAPPSGSLAKPAAPAQPAPAKVAATPPVKTQTPVPPAVAPAAMPTPPPLDLKSLETQLKATKAIGVFTKLSLKNQIDDLLGRLRAFHQGGVKTSLVELRRSFDMLMMKTLALLQDADPSLAGSLTSSRESIWGILSDPAKFAKV